MLTAPTFAAALVSGLRAHGHRPSGPAGRRWSAVADEARTLALGLVEVGVRPGSAVRIRLHAGVRPEALIAAELAVLASGAALAVDDEVGPDLELDATALRGLGADRPLVDVRAAGAELDRHRPAAHEERLAGIEPADVAVLGDGLVVTHAQAVWAFRSVASWIGPAVPDGPQTVLLAPPGRETVAAALVGRWWPAASGAALAAGDDLVAAARQARPDIVVGDAASWTVLADALRAEAARTRAGTTLLRRGRVLVAGEVASRAERVGRGVAERRAGARVRSAAGLDALALGVCLGPLDLATGRDLAAAGLPVVTSWVEPGVPAPVASGPRARPAPAEPWGRPLPGRTIEVGPPVVVHGGDLGPAGAASASLTEVDPRGRVLLPRPAADRPRPSIRPAPETSEALDEGAPGERSA
ncbi:MAG TPA: hypothetical protein VK507_18480 [Iamia sp.]|nr:hypothetical protein [Iamia sp.]